MNIIRIALVLVGVSVYQLTAFAAPKKVSWRNHALAEGRTLASLPKELKDAASSGGRIADRGGKFNATDVVDGKSPMRRFIVAGTDESTVLLALEHGGRGYSIEAIEFLNNEGKWTEVNRWTFFKKPRNLQDLVNLIETVKK
jgi:hypothetical protein